MYRIFLWLVVLAIPQDACGKPAPPFTELAAPHLSSNIDVFGESVTEKENIVQITSPQLADNPTFDNINNLFRGSQFLPLPTDVNQNPQAPSNEPPPHHSNHPDKSHGNHDTPVVVPIKSGGKHGKHSDKSKKHQHKNGKISRKHDDQHKKHKKHKKHHKHELPAIPKQHHRSKSDQPIAIPIIIPGKHGKPAHSVVIIEPPQPPRSPHNMHSMHGMHDIHAMHRRHEMGGVIIGHGVDEQNLSTSSSEIIVVSSERPVE